jgi:glycosyltransferase involved in cell wall biosynthesis
MLAAPAHSSTSTRRSIAAVIPALDEEGAIGGVVRALVALVGPDGDPLLDEVVVADNGSTDRTAEVARAAGATVVPAPRRGYGSACLEGIAHLARRAAGPPEVVVFADGDGSSDPADVAALTTPILAGEVALVVGSRVARAAPGSLTLPQRFGNRLATTLLDRVYGARYSDLGPHRAIRWSALLALGMEDRDYGWTVEMQVKAAKARLAAREIDVASHPRVAGESKVAGTVRGVLGAGYKILWTLYRYR